MLQYTHRFGKHLLLEFQLNHLFHCSRSSVVLVPVFICPVPPGQGDSAVQIGLSSHNIIISRLGSGWSAQWSLMISSLNGSQRCHAVASFPCWKKEKTLLPSAAAQLFCMIMKSNVADMFGGHRPLDGARDLLWILAWKMELWAPCRSHAADKFLLFENNMHELFVNLISCWNIWLQRVYIISINRNLW